MLLGEEDQDYLCTHLHVFVHTYKEIKGRKVFIGRGERKGGGDH